MSIIHIGKMWLLLAFINFSILGCNPPNETQQLNVDRDIPASEDFDASYGFWGPDSKTIYFTHSEELGTDPDPGQLDQLWKLNLETGRRSKIHGGRILNADISPDGKWLVFNSFFPPQYLYKMRSDGSELKKLTGDNSPNPDWKYTIQGKWSPDGSQILFSLSAGVPRGVSVMDNSGSNSHIVIPFGVEPNWVPQNNDIVYLNWDSTKVRNIQEQIYRADSNGSNTVKLTNLENTYFNIHAPKYSPDGKKIVFIYQNELYLRDTKNNSIEQITDGAGYTVRPEWSPDGKTILFSRIIPNVSKRLYYLDVATHQVQPVFSANK